MTDHTRTPNKFNAVKVEIDGYTFASKAEAKRYTELKLQRDAGLISMLDVHPVFPLEINGVYIGRFTPDFSYTTGTGCQIVVEDVKGGRATKTEAYSLRKRVFQACYGIKLTEIGVPAKRKKKV